MDIASYHVESNFGGGKYRRMTINLPKFVGFYTTNLANHMTTDFGGFLMIFEECINFWPVCIWGWVGRAGVRWVIAKVKQKSRTTQMTEFRVVMKSNTTNTWIRLVSCDGIFQNGSYFWKYRHVHTWKVFANPVT